LQGDVYLSAPTLTATTTTVAMDPAVVQQVNHWPGVRQAYLLRSLEVESTQGPMELSASSNPNIAAERLLMHPADPQAIWQAMEADGVLVSEPLARRLNLFDPGSTVTLRTAAGWQSFAVVGVFYDYSSSEGSLLMAMDVYRRLWQDDAVTAINLRLAPGADADQVTRSLQDGLHTSQRLVVRPNRVLRQEVLAVFDRTFAITTALQILATVVAFIGVLNTLMLLQLEKQREAGILRALGLTGRQLWRLVMLETGLMGLTAGLLAAPAGYALAWILVYVINRRSFGWTLQLTVQPEAFLQALLIALAAALLAGIYPARRLSRMAAADAIRYE
ncbi:MAG: ABC transporter permease, partial [Chloroflexi bacterium]|nr:ABC transporter permease [Chloroflexota bacterium]